jgi:hypothetical protein
MTDWLERLQPGEIPIFRHTHQALAGFGPRREHLTAREIAQEVLADPLATLHTLHIVNKKVAQRYGTEVPTVEHALMMQGIGAYLDAARGLPILETTPAGRDARALKALRVLSRRAQHAAWQARDFAVQHSDIHAEEVQVAAILWHLPEMLLWLRAPDAARRLERLGRTVSAAEAEMEVLGQSMGAFRLGLLEAWSIPELTRDLLDERHAERARQTILAASLDIARRSERGWWDEGFLAAYDALAGVVNLPVENVIATVHANAARVARVGGWLEATPSAAWVPMIPGPWPREADEDAAAAPAPGETARPLAAPPQPEGVATVALTGKSPALAEAPPAPVAVTPTPPPAPAPVAAPAVQPSRPAPAETPGHTVCPMPDKQVFRETLKGIEGHLDGSLNLNQMSALVLKGLHTGLGLSRILFAMITPDGERVKSRFTLGIPADDSLRHFEFRLDGKDLFAQLMGKMQGVWINEGNRERLWPMVDPRLRTLIGAGDFYAMSLFNGGKPLGLIYADRGHGECGLDPLTYTDFKMLCLQAARGMARIKG